MNNTNRLITSDNLGYAAIMLEKERNSYNLPGKVRVLTEPPCRSNNHNFFIFRVNL